MDIWFTHSKVIHMYSTYFPDMFHSCPHAFPMFFLITDFAAVRLSRPRVETASKTSAGSPINPQRVSESADESQEDFFKHIMSKHPGNSHFSASFWGLLSGYLNRYKNRRWTGSSFKTYFFVRLSVINSSMDLKMGFLITNSDPRAGETGGGHVDVNGSKSLPQKIHGNVERLDLLDSCSPVTVPFECDIFSTLWDCGGS